MIWPALSWRKVDVAVYDDSRYTYGGAWATGLNAIKSMLETYGYTYMTVTPDNVNQTDLSSIYENIEPSSRKNLDKHINEC